MKLAITINTMIFIYLFACFSIALSVYCPLTENTKLEIIKTRNYYECPSNYPPHYTECCGENQCCPSDHAIFYEIDQNLAFLVAFSVSLLCFAFSVLLVLCCFCPSCLFYNSCRMRYTRDDAGFAHKMGETPMYTNMMPMESPNGHTVVIAHPLSDKPNGFINDYKCKEAAV